MSDVKIRGAGIVSRPSESYMRDARSKSIPREPYTVHPEHLKRPLRHEWDNLDDETKWAMYGTKVSVAWECKNEIERLTAQNERLKSRGIEDMQHEIKELRALLAHQPETRTASFFDLSYGVKFSYEIDSAIWVKIGHDTVARWDESNIDTRWIGQPLCSFCDDGDFTRTVYIREPAPTKDGS